MTQLVIEGEAAAGLGDTDTVVVEGPKLQLKAASRTRSTGTTSVGRVLVVACCFNEGEKIRAQLRRYPVERDYDVLLIDDGGTDKSLADADQSGVTVVSHEVNRGAGRGLKTAHDYALHHDYDVLVVMAGNNKDEPREIPRLLEKLSEGFDFVQGSRHLSGGSHRGMPIYRRLATRLHPILFSLAARKWVTESTNGFRAFRTSLLRDARIDWRQDWLDRYELEPYLLFKAITLGYRHAEVPVTKTYPPRKLGYTKMKPLSGWWSILRPIFLLWTGLRT